MAKPQGLTLKDLIASQQSLAMKGDLRAAEQVERLSAMQKSLVEQEKIAQQDKLMQAIQTVETIKADKDDDKIVKSIDLLQKESKKGLLAKTGDGLNANVIKLTKAIQKNSDGLAKTLAGEGNKYKPSAAEVAKGRVESLKPEGTKYKEGFLGNLKRRAKAATTLEGWFKKRADGEEAGGMVDAALQKKFGERDFVKDQIATGATTNPELAKKRFEKVNEIQGNIKKDVAEYEGMKERGLSEEQIARTGVVDKLGASERKLTIADPLRRERAMPVSAQASAAPTSSAPVAFAAPATSGGEETQQETLRVTEGQSQYLKQIADNTAGMLASLGGKPAEAAPAEGGGGGGGGLLDGLGSRLGGKLLRGGGKLLGKAGGLLGRAGGSIASGAASLATKATPLMSSAGGFMTSTAGKALGAVGAVGMGAYDTYQGWTGAEEELAAGKITEDEADVKKTAAVGKGVGGAGGALAGAATGAAIGSVVPVVGTAIGGLVGGAVGYMGGSAVGETVGEYGSKAWKATKGFFGATPTGADEVAAKSAEVADANRPNQSAGGNQTNIVAPTTNISNTTQAPIRQPVRNTDSSYQAYNRQRFAY